ncbi:hypothetical protein SAMN02910384_01606 [Pseudobutyrivibrio sp. ACV-2]|uniref:TadE/TadG family type IV pilus assembly protein n=1 Tax=Pseudobutyrivibrio sp. ACV-2 TaxID=1520801 RepID=UPI00089A0872|nr:TadE family protein [Pseudobutyrivibrio sp. ACV-2]SEA48353.1 hypothetical protein SAMN02910384_01606 [Pseudobutyrivibrio sp. ACV-2]
MSLFYKKPYLIAPDMHGGPPAAKRTIKHFSFISQIQGQNNIYQPEMPFYASSKKASYTIEAAVIMPLFITLMVFGMFIFRLLQVQSGVQQSINATSRTMSVALGNLANSGTSDTDVDTSDEEPTIEGLLSEGVLIGAAAAKTAVEMEDRHVPIEFIDGGAAGFSFLGTSFEGNYVDIKVDYQMTFPVGLLGHYTFDVSQRARTRKWVGYDKTEDFTDSRYVFITEKGEHYHMNYHCTYLNPSVHRLPIEELEAARNKGGAKYYRCERCKGKTTRGFVFVTDYGTSFHGDINCSEIKHNIKKVLYEEVKDIMPACSKCGH